MMKRKEREYLKRIISESLEECLVKKGRITEDDRPEEYDWMKGLEMSMDDVKKKFSTEAGYDDRKAGGDYEINNTNPVFYVNGREMTAQSISPFHNDFAIVKCNGQQGFIDKDGELLGGKFFAACDDFEDGWGKVKDETGKFNYINAEGEYLLPTWVSRTSGFMGGEAIVMNNGERYKIDTKGNIL